MTNLIEGFYGLNKAPFTLNRSRGPVLMTEPLREAANFLLGHLKEDAPILSVTGPAGIGKSCFGRALQKIVGGDWKVATMSGRSDSWDEFGSIMSKEFQIDGTRLTREDLENAREKVGKPLIVVDDAQFLSPGLLERICILPQLRTAFGEPVVQVILLADLDAVLREEMRPLLAWVDAEARHEMGAMPLGDVHRFIDTCLRRAGWEGQPLVCEAGAGAIHRISLGNPRQLSASCMDVLERAATRGLKLIDAEFVVECMSDAKTSAMREPLSVAPGTALCEEPTAYVPTETEKYPFAAIPLTAENIVDSDSIELADATREAEYSGTIAAAEVAPIHSMSALAQSNSRVRMPSLRAKPRTNGRPSLTAVVLAVLAALTFYFQRAEVVDLLQEIGLKVPFATQTLGAADGQVDAIGDTSASADGLEGAAGDTFAMVGSQSHGEEALGLPADLVVGENDLVRY